MSTVSLVVTRLQWLCPDTFEMRFKRPTGFDFVPGQKIDFTFQDTFRTYTLVSGPDEGELSICVRHVPQGRISPLLSRAKEGDCFQATPAYGYFAYQPSRTTALFVATGTGIAPYVSFARNGIRGFYLLHGVRTAEQLYYREILTNRSATYIPCLSGGRSTDASLPHYFQGRVTNYLEHILPNGSYDFYLCGRSEMLADAIRIIDDRFEGSKVFTEMFY